MRKLNYHKAHAHTISECVTKRRSKGDNKTRIGQVQESSEMHKIVLETIGDATHEDFVVTDPGSVINVNVGQSTEVAEFSLHLNSDHAAKTLDDSEFTFAQQMQDKEFTIDSLVNKEFSEITN